MYEKCEKRSVNSTSLFEKIWWPNNPTCGTYYNGTTLGSEESTWRHPTFSLMWVFGEVSLLSYRNFRHCFTGGSCSKFGSIWNPFIFSLYTNCNDTQNFIFFLELWRYDGNLLIWKRKKFDIIRLDINFTPHMVESKIQEKRGKTYILPLLKKKVQEKEGA